MTGNYVIDLLISVAGIAILVGFSFLLGAMKSAIVDLASASDRLSFDEPDFRASRWMVGADGKAAAAVSADGRETALVFSVGDGLASRRFRHGSVGLEKVGAAIDFQLNEPSRVRVRLAAADKKAAEQWLLSLGGPRL